MSDSNSGATDAGALTREEVRAQVAGLLQEDVAELSDEDSLLDWGLDSMRIMTLVEQWRKRGVQVTFADLAEQSTLDEWWKVLKL